MRRVVVLLLAAAGAVSCLATTDLDGLGGGGEAVPGDAQVDGGDAGDGSNAGGGDVATATGCAGRRELFCADFDQGAVTSNWDDAEEKGGGTVVAVTTASSSPPRSMFAHVPAIDGTNVGSAKARLLKSFNDAAAGGHVSFDLFVGALPSSGPQAEIAVLYFTGSSETYALYLVLRESGDAIIEYLQDAGTTLATFALPKLLPRGVWTNIELDASLRDKQLDVLVDHQSALTKPLTPPIESGDPRLRVGISVSGASGEVGVNFDNVTFDPL